MFLLKSSFVFFVLLYHTLCLAEVEVLFVQKKDFQGNVVRLQPHEDFYHVALVTPYGLLNARPYYGVEFLNSLDDLGYPDYSVTVLRLSGDIKYQQYHHYLGLPYDSEFDWDDKAIYCSELVAKILNIAPSPMRFEGDHWPRRLRDKQGLPGLSPDLLFHKLRLLGAYIQNRP